MYRERDFLVAENDFISTFHYRILIDFEGVLQWCSFVKAGLDVSEAAFFSCGESL